MNLGDAKAACLASMLVFALHASAADVDQDGVDDFVDRCCNTPLGVAVYDFGAARGDYDWDCDVDRNDAPYLLFDFGQSSGELTADIDGDFDADLADYWYFQRAYSPETPGACCAEQAMEYGTSREGLIEEYVGHSYCFDGLAGDQVTIYLERVSGGRLYLGLSGPDWAYFSSCAAPCQYDCLNLPGDGTYFIGVGPWLAEYGGYRLHLTRCLGEEDPTILVVNEPFQGRIDPVGERDTFDFTAPAGVLHYVQFTPQADAGDVTLGVLPVLGGPTQYCNAACTLFLPVQPGSRPYQLTVDAPEAATADYQLLIYTLD